MPGSQTGAKLPLDFGLALGAKMWHVAVMQIAASDNDQPEEHTQYRTAFAENLQLVLDILDVMRDESVHMGYWQEAGFVACVEDVLRSFERSRPTWMQG